MAFFSSKWAAVNTQPHREALAIEHLQRQNFECYCPMVRKSVRHARKQHEVLRPLFPGYLFVAIDPDIHRWRPILSTIGVRTLVRCGERLAMLGAEFIDALKARELDGAICRPSSPYRVGQEVRITGGALDGLVATIIEKSEKDRLVVLLELLNRPVRVKLDSQQVREVA